MATAITILFSLLIITDVVNSNMIFELKHKYDALPPQESMIARWQNDQRRHGRSLSSVDVEVGAMGYMDTGLFFTNIMVGEPPKNYPLLIDTASDLTWLYCGGCKRCPSASSFGFKIIHYMLEASKNGKKVKCSDPLCPLANNGTKTDLCTDDGICKYRVLYDASSVTSGYLVSDTITLNKVSGDSQTSQIPFEFKFGCGVDQFGGLESEPYAFNGHLGFAKTNISLLHQLSDAKLVKNSFCHCLRSDFKGGTFALGEVVVGKPLQTIPFVPEQLGFAVVTKLLQFGKLSLDITKSVTLIDISTSFNAFPNDTYNAIMDNIKSSHKNINFSPPDPFVCFVFDGSIEDDFPKFTYHLEGGVELDLLPQQYLYENKPSEWCITIDNSKSLPVNKDCIIIGANVMVDKLVVYDIEKEVIGIVNYNCSSTIKMKDTKTGKAFNVQSHEITLDSKSKGVKIGGGIILVCLLSMILNYFAFCY